MRIFLIRHGETVDNVAMIYAGVRDSELTNHGFQQATRLGEFFHSNGVEFAHIYSSHLQRAYKTAELIRKGQLAREGTADAAVPVVNRVPLLVEQDFGFYEGKRNIPRADASQKSGKQDHYEQHRGLPGFKEPESPEFMAKRMDEFLDEHLLPLIAVEGATHNNVAIVSHGLILSVLWKRLLKRMSPKSVSIEAELLGTRQVYSIEHLGGWSNTGYMELEFSPAASQHVDGSNLPDDSKPAIVPPSPAANAQQTSAPIPWTLTVKAINNRDHLRGFKRTGGGVGSSKHDEGQKTIDSFFKRRKVT